MKHITRSACNALTLSLCLTYGAMIPLVYAEPALQDIQQLAESSDADAQPKLGERSPEGKGAVPQNDEQAIKWLRNAAEQNNVRAQYLLGLMYDSGKDVPQNHQQASAWFRKAAELGYADAQYVLGAMYREGDTVPKDATLAIEWFHKAAKQGDVSAQYILGVIYHEGEGTLQDNQQAATWFRKAAEQGDSGAQNFLGQMYHKGDGVPQDNKQAYAWFSVAGEELQRDLVAKHLTPAEQKEAQALAKRYLEQYAAE